MVRAQVAISCLDDARSSLKTREERAVTMVLPSYGPDFSAHGDSQARNQMSKRPVLIAGISLLVICAGIWGLQAMTRQGKPIVAASAASTQANGTHSGAQ